MFTTKTQKPPEYKITLDVDGFRVEDASTGAAIIFSEANSATLFCVGQNVISGLTLLDTPTTQVQS